MTHSKAASLLALVIAAVIVGGSGLAAAQAPPIIPVKERRFDHDQHAKILKDAGKQDVVCAGCHKVKPDTGAKVGRDHARCDGAGCHTLDVAERSCDSVRISGPKSPARQCQICHVPSNKRCLPADLPPKPTETSFVAHFAHNRHMGLGDSAKATCVDCHEQEVAGSMVAPTDAHSACSGCHNGRGVKIGMDQCSACHVNKANAQVAPRDDFTLIPFDHAKHNQKSNLGGQCLTCHKGIDAANATNEWQMPKPAMQTCIDGCHDGKKGAFNAVGTTCTRCHHGNGPTTATPPASRVDLAFSHEAHRKRNVNLDDCASCHTVEKDGKIDPPNIGKDHAPCANAGCHQTEFESKTPKICGACHDNAAPWMKATARLRTDQKREFFGAINHQTHIKLAGSKNDACTGCHGNKLQDAPGPKQHEGCATGGKCHGGPSAPQMTDCKLCHKTEAAGRAPASEWSVAATFKHSTHATDPRNKSATACALCHAEVPNATDLKTLKLPEMKLCDSCHDGKTSFKTTGFECARCHQKAPAAPAATTSWLQTTTPIQLSMVGDPR
jgi:c(7)-type cytochrome triheme protein